MMELARTKNITLFKVGRGSYELQYALVSGTVEKYQFRTRSFAYYAFRRAAAGVDPNTIFEE